ncbi:DNA primase [Micromonospora sp. NPDC003197]
MHTEVSVARQSSQRPDADEPETKLDETTGPADPDETDDIDTAEAVEVDRSLWDQVRIDPVEIALPAGAGFTLRAYRLSNELTPTDTSDRDQDDPFLARAAVLEDDEEVVILDEEFAAALEEEAEEARTARRRRRTDKDETDSDETDRDETEAELDEDEAEAEEEAEAEPEPEEVPVFLSHRGKLLIFKSAEGLVSFVRSGAPNDLAQLDTWDELVERLEPAHIAPLDEDSYELDLVVENLRGGHDVWDPTLIIEAGEVARDLAYGLRLPSVLDMLSSGSSLDDLDEALRSTANGGLGGFFGRRRLKKIGAQTASLGWRTIIGKISAAVDWRD